MAKMTSGQKGLLKLPDDSVIKDPYYIQGISEIRDSLMNYGDNNRYVNLADFNKSFSQYFQQIPELAALYNTGTNNAKKEYERLMGGYSDRGGAFYSEHKRQIEQLQAQFRDIDINTPEGLEQFASSYYDPGMKSGYGGGLALSGETIKKIANQWYGQRLNASGAPDPSQVQGYSTDLAATNQQITEQQANQQKEYSEWKEAQKLPAAQYQLWLQKKQAEMDKAGANESVNAVQDSYFEDLPTGVTTPITSKTALASGSAGSSIGTFTGMYNDALKTANISDLQTQLGDLNMQIANQQNIYQQRLNAVGGQTVSLDVIGGKQSEIAKQEQANLNFLTNQKSALVDQINTSMQMVETYMKYQQMDYQAAQDAYEMQYKQQMDMLNYAQEERSYEQKTALANLTILQNQISKGELDVSKLSEDEKLQINKLELQSGLPIGTTQKMIGQVKGDEILFHEVRDEADGNSYLYTTRKATDGIIRTIKEYLGPQEPKAAKSGGGGGSGGSSSKSSGLPSGNSMTTTRFNSMIGEIAKMDSSDYGSWKSNYDYLVKKYYEASPDDIIAYLGGQPAGGVEGEAYLGRQITNEEKAVSGITDWITDYFTF